MRVRERVSNKNEKADVSLVFFPDDQARIRVVEEFVESVNKNQRHRNLGLWSKKRLQARKISRTCVSFDTVIGPNNEPLNNELCSL